MSDITKVKSITSYLRIFITVLIVVFIVEVIIMFVLYSLFPGFHKHALYFIDAFSLVALCTPILWLLIVKPLRRITQTAIEERTHTDNTNTLLKLFSQTSSRKEYLDRVAELIRRWSECRCIGIRVLDKEGNIPYESYVGFSQEFWDSENLLSIKRDQCACIRVITGNPEPQDKSAMTQGGSFCLDNSVKFINELRDEERARFRGVCVKCGFKSIVIVPIRYKDKILGAIHLADEREGLIPPNLVEFIESMSPLIGEAVYKFNIEDELMKHHVHLQELVEERTKELNTAMELLKNNEERFRSVTMTATDAVICADSHNNIILWNRSTEKIFGYSADEIVGKPISLVMPERYRKDHIEGFNRCVSTRESHLIGKTIELVGLRKDGSEFPLELSLAKWETSEGIHFTAIIRDTTERKRIEEELRKHRDHLEGLVKERTEELERNYDIQSVINLFLNFSLEDIPFEEVLRRSLDLLLSIPWLAFQKKGALFLVEDEPDVLIMKVQNGLQERIQGACKRIPFGKCLCGKAALTKELQFADCLDERHEIYYTDMSPHGHYCVPVLHSGKTIGAINVYLKEGHRRSEKEEDFLNTIAHTLAGIIVRRQAEEHQKQLEQRYRELVEGIDAIVWEADPETWKFTFVSQRAETISGYPVEEWLNKPDFWVNHIHPDDRKNAVSFCQVSTQKGENHEFEYRMIAKDDSVVWLRDLVTVKCVNGKPVLLKGVMIDITPLKRAEEEKERVQTQLLQIQKMESIGMLAGGVAHDFNNILTIIQGCTELARMKVGKENSLYEELEQIDSAADRAAGLTRQLLLFSRGQSMTPTVVNINGLIDDLLKMLNRLIGEDNIIKTDIAPNLWTVWADKGNIEQVLMNLVVNARDAIPEGGTLTLKTENIQLGEEDCKIILHARPGKFVTLSVADTGVGMSQEIINHIFDPFFSTKEQGKGTGLGLSVVYGVVKQHEGWVNVFSEPGKGSVFTVFLPAYSERLESETEKKTLVQEFKGNGERILLVEDEEGVRRFTKKALSENGYVVFESANAEESLNVFEKEGRNFHLVISDVVLPGESGIELVDELHLRKPELPILLVSGYTNQKVQPQSIKEKGYHFLQKPYALTTLFRAIKEAIGM